MKNQKRNQKNKRQTTDSLSQKIKSFLEARSDSCSLATQLKLEDTLARFVDYCGDIPFAQVTINKVRKFSNDPAKTSPTNRHRLLIIKGFLNWCREQGDVCEELVKSVLGLQVEFPAPRPRILTPEQLQALLSGTSDVEVLVFIALSAFAGIRLAELQRLHWDAIRPGTGIHIGPDVSMVGERVIKIHPNLDAWLRPFYGVRGPVVRSRNIAARLHTLGNQVKVNIPRQALRHSYCAYYLALVADVTQVATKSGHMHPHLGRCFTARVSAHDAKKFFSLTPDTVGLKDWPKLVAKYLT